MYFVDRCLVCDSGSLLHHPAVTSPFIAQMVGWTAPQRCSLAECAGCGHRFFDLRLDGAEMERLYRDYRGREYFAIRHRWEPWYTEALNEGLGHDRQEIDFRRGYVLEFLRKSLPAAAFAGEVLDYGGDRGQFIPPELGRKKYLFDFSDNRPVEGVVRLTEKQMLRRPFDVVMLCHVLEHQPDPVRLLLDLQEEIGPPSGEQWIYAEVPLERPRLMKRPEKNARRGSVTWTRWARPLWLALDVYSTALRLKLGIVPPLAVIKLHEHLSFFSDKSLRTLFERAGFLVQACEVTPVSSPSGLGAVLKLLARRTC